MLLDIRYRKDACHLLNVLLGSMEANEVNSKKYTYKVCEICTCTMITYYQTCIYENKNIYISFALFT
jgi:hypothetical protein